MKKVLAMLALVLFLGGISATAAVATVNTKAAVEMTDEKKEDKKAEKKAEATKESKDCAKECEKKCDGEKK